MAEKRKKIVYQTEDGLVRLTVARASAVMGMQRSLLQVRGVEQSAGQPEAVLVLRQITYPDLVAPVVEAEGRVQTNQGETLDFADWPFAFEQFAELPDDLIVIWENAVYAVNPHWNPAGNIEAEQEKKVEN